MSKENSKVKEVEKVGVQRDFKKLFQPFLFTISVGCVSYVGASIWQYENLRRKVRKINGGVVGGGGGVKSLVEWFVSRGADGGGHHGLELRGFPALQPTMIKYFTASPYSGAPCVSMFLSSFSHHSFFHLFANMYVLWSFTPSISAILGQEQFLATYVTAGAIMAVLGMVCSRHPDAHLSIAFVDKLIPHSFSAGSVNLYAAHVDVCLSVCLLV
ncbi:hypothetical protein HELRODRAFT_178960 [Helobdella robusta]|uniref:rhomboid protease n=1 Tax=Helobdella robusta TaxID=6412 RepID=T1FDZ0_HELRO|nr:hypothetical protein HELRODRAFT_178960 [Helobdella robusta]ESN95779.1 hypothetical protein HELRODRAFT_178960 [Helobdella robusta]